MQLNIPAPPTLRLFALRAITVVVCATGCGAAPPAGPATPGRLEILVSADTAGWIVPCGCTSNQSGGMPRRGSLVSEARKRAEVITADAGGAASGTTLYDRLKFAAVLRGEKALGVVAHNLGAAEAALGADELKRLARELDIPFVSANLRDSAGAPISEAVRTIEVAGRRVSFIGVVSPALVSAGLQALPPQDAVLAALANLQPRPELVVVLAYLPEDELAELAAALPEVDAVVGGPTGQSLAPRRLGPTTLVSVTNKGKFIAALRFAAVGRAAPEVQIVELSDRYPDDPTQVDNVQAFYRELAARDLGAADTSFVPHAFAGAPTGSSVAGSESCRHCHTAETEVWRKSSHARAWQTLVQRGAHVDAACQHCHTTGFGRSGGFVSVVRSATRIDVGCESCHGPSAAHVADPEKPTGFGVAARDQCASCHDRENSPNFKLDDYWRQVAHGGAVKPSTAAPTIPGSKP